MCAGEMFDEQDVSYYPKHERGDSHMFIVSNESISKEVLDWTIQHLGVPLFNVWAHDQGFGFTLFYLYDDKDAALFRLRWC